MRIPISDSSTFPSTASSEGSVHRKSRFGARIPLILLFLAALLAFPPVTRAEDRFFASKIEAVKNGDYTLQELSLLLISEAEKGALNQAQIHETFSDLPKLVPIVLSDMSDRLKAFLMIHDTSGAESLRQLLAELYALHPDATLKLNQLMDTAETGDELVRKSDASELVRLIEAAPTLAEKQILASRLAKIPDAAATAIGSIDDPFMALKTLGAVGSGLPLATANAIAASLIGKLAETRRQGNLDLRNWSLDDPSVGLVIRNASVAQPELHAALAPLYEARIRKLLELDEVRGLMEAYSGLLETRPDPSEANDSLRYEIIYGAEGDAVRQFALGRIQELKYSDKLSKLSQFRIMLNGYYGTNVMIFFVISTGVILLLGGLMIIRPLFISTVTEAISNAEARSAAAAERERAAQAKRPSVKMRDTDTGANTRKIRRPLIQSGKPVSGYMRGPVEDDEYSRLLRFFELDDSASDSDIKKAYRERVKALHPDARPGEVRTQDEDFIELKEVYDRILEIRGSWFGGKR